MGAIESNEVIESIKRLSKDLKRAAATLTEKEARYIVDNYYRMQEFRKATENQGGALGKSGNPHELIDWIHDGFWTIESAIKAMMDVYSDSKIVGLWAKSIRGIGPVISAALLAHIDMDIATTASKIERFAGLDPTVKWEKGKKRPWNATLKVVCWKIGESFVKTCNSEDSFYGKLYLERKKIEQAKNESGAFADQAREILETKNWNKKTDAYIWYSGGLSIRSAKKYRDAVNVANGNPVSISKYRVDVGGTPMLPPAHIHARAKRWAVKKFISHWHHVAHVEHYGCEPRKPYVLEHVAGHEDYMPPPNWPMK